MEQQITIARPADQVFAYLADPRHLRDWLPHLRREEGPLPEEGLEADAAAGTVRWRFAPAGRWQVRAVQDVAVLHLHLETERATPTDPTEQESPGDALAHGMEAALHSLKSHLEGVAGGDPDLHTAELPQSVYGRGRDPDEGGN